MSTVAEIESALQKLPIDQARRVADWLQDYLKEKWDCQLAADSVNGQLDKLWAKAKSQIDAGQVKPLDEILRDS